MFLSYLKSGAANVNKPLSYWTIAYFVSTASKNIIFFSTHQGDLLSFTRIQRHNNIHDLKGAGLNRHGWKAIADDRVS